MNCEAKPVTIVVAEDDPDDRLLIKEALEEVRIANPIDFVKDGQQLLDYLRREGNYTGLSSTFPPGLILLDLNMPVMDGREVLLEIRGDPELKRIPVVVLTSSDADEDIIRTYDLGVNSFIKKPVETSEFAGFPAHPLFSGGCERHVRSLRPAVSPVSTGFS